MDSKTEYDQLNLAHETKKKTPVPTRRQFTLCLCSHSASNGIENRMQQYLQASATGVGRL